MTAAFDAEPFFPADLEPLQGDGDRIRSAGRMLHDAAGALDYAQRASQQLQTLTDGVSWQGSAFEAFKGGLEKRPLPEHLVNARNVLGWTGDELARLASVIDDIQAESANLRQRADLLGIQGPVPEERRAEVEAIKLQYEDLKERRERALDQAAHVIDEMTDKTVFARPPPKGLARLRKAIGSAVHFTKEFAVGLGEGLTEMGKGFLLIASLVTPQGMSKAVHWYMDNKDLVRQAITYAMHDPIGMATNVGKVFIDYDTLRQSPGRWLGKLAPTIAVTIATAGAGGVATRSSAIVQKADELKNLGKVVDAARWSKTYTKMFEGKVKLPGLGNFGPTEELTTSQAFRKGVYDMANTKIRNVATLGAYGRVKRAQYLMYDRKTLPMWGKLVKKVPIVTSQAGRIAAQDGLQQSVSGTIREGADQAEAEAQAQTQAPVGGG